MEDTKDCLKARHILGILGFLGFANVYAMRVNLSVAIVAMVNSTTNPVANASTFDHCPVPNITNTTVVSRYFLFIILVRNLMKSLWIFHCKKIITNKIVYTVCI